jgi:hypothetical protein
VRRSSLVLALVVAVSGCDSSDSAGIPCTANAPCNCTYNSADGGIYKCDSFSMPACPSGAGTNAVCDSYDGGCMGCSQTAGFTCRCGPMSDAGLRWFCVGTGYACTGP